MGTGEECKEKVMQGVRKKQILKSWYTDQCGGGQGLWGLPRDLNGLAVHRSQRMRSRQLKTVDIRQQKVLNGDNHLFNWINKLKKKKLIESKTFLSRVT